MGFRDFNLSEAIQMVGIKKGRSEVSADEVISWMMDDDNAQCEELADTGATGGRETERNVPAEPPGSQSPVKGSSMSSESAAVRRQDSDSHTSADETQGTKSLKERNKLLKQKLFCKICKNKKVNILFLPCSHLVCCKNCATNKRNCPVCRKEIRGQVGTCM